MTPNRLINEKSPYLLQHAYNPVNWYPWEDEAFARARAENKPVFLSVGYATCHWCHVMEKESFEDEEAARCLNDTFICIKVDREERPDIDAVYMTACQMLNQSGGWPLTIFMTPDKKPFFAATYLPKRTRMGRIGLIELCDRVKELWASQREKALEAASAISETLNKSFVFSSGGDLTESVLNQAFSQIEQSFDPQFGGFDPAPKFPTPHRLLFLLRYYHRTRNAKTLEIVKKTLIAMRLGGLWDHIGFGFHRYSTDKQWLVPHFEKMLYDQAQLAIAYLETFQVTGDLFYAKTAEEIFAYVLRDMTSADGAFFAAEDADSEGEEGKFYVWKSDEFRNILGHEEAAFWERIFNLREDGNFLEEASRKKTGTNILHLEMPLSEWAEKAEMTEDELAARWEKIRETLFQVRKKRVHPLKDDKVLTDWNGLMIAALAAGARILDRTEYAKAARKAARFILTKMKDSEGRLLHRFRKGEAGITANANDYAFLIMGLLALYQTELNADDLTDAAILQQQMFRDYRDQNTGGFFLTAKENSDLPARPKELYDGAMPSANSVSFLNLLHLARLTGDPQWEKAASEIARSFSGTVKHYPSAYTYFLMGADFSLSKSREVVIAGDPDAADTRAMLSVLNSRFAPNQVVILKSEQNAAQLEKIAGFTAKMESLEGKATAYICINFSCSRPTTDIEKLRIEN
jgi:uncharacterized protein YyaL (SSP411 family)